MTRPYALAVAACGEGRRPLEPWRNLGCYDMAVWFAPFGGHTPHPLPLPSRLPAIDERGARLALPVEHRAGRETGAKSLAVDEGASV